MKEKSILIIAFIIISSSFLYGQEKNNVFAVGNFYYQTTNHNNADSLTLIKPQSKVLKFTPSFMWKTKKGNFREFELKSLQMSKEYKTYYKHLEEKPEFFDLDKKYIDSTIYNSFFYQKKRIIEVGQNYYLNFLKKSKKTSLSLIFANSLYYLNVFESQEESASSPIYDFKNTWILGTNFKMSLGLGYNVSDKCFLSFRTREFLTISLNGGNSIEKYTTTTKPVPVYLRNIPILNLAHSANIHFGIPQNFTISLAYKL